MIRGVLAHPPRFLTVDEVLTLHETAIDEHGGAHGIREPGLLESALAMPLQGFAGAFAHEAPFGMASAYLFHICKNHPFVDGNKRTSLASAVTFLRLNGWDLTASEDSVVQVVLDVATGAMSKEQVAAWLEAHCRPRSSLELREFFHGLSYTSLASVFAAIAVGTPEERAATFSEAAVAIPSIAEASISALHAEEHGDGRTAALLRQHAMLLTSVYRIAEGLGYEW